jgi:threonine 3-dehydrogenase
MYETWYHAEMMLTTGLDITPIITHRFKADDYQKAFKIMESGEAGKIILEWD